MILGLVDGAIVNFKSTKTNFYNHIKPIEITMNPLENKMITLTWDGTHLGSIPQAYILQEYKIPNTYEKYWLVSGGPFHFKAIVRNVKDNYACIADELKPLFGLPKNGTHTICLNRAQKKYLLLKPIIGDDGKAQPEEDLRDCPPEQLNDTGFFRHAVRDIFAFRYLLGMSNSREQCIRLRPIDRENPYSAIYPVSLVDTRCVYIENKGTIPGTTINRWFGEMDGLAQAIRELIGWGQINKNNRLETQQITNIVSTYRTRIEQVINRVDRSWIWISTYLVDRIMDALPYRT